jgi:hypothetical protein
MEEGKLGEKAKRIYGKWTPEDMKSALNEYREGKIRLNECCRKYKIPKKTFLRHCRGEVGRSLDRGDNAAVNGRDTALPIEAEHELVQVILQFEASLFGLTPVDVRKLAFQILEANTHLTNPFNKEKRMAGKKWYYGFLKRNPKLSLRQPENISIHRVKGFNKESVYHFFDVLETIVNENKLNGFRIFNMDETGFQTVQKRSPKVLAEKGKRQVGAISSAERGVNTTVVCCTNANGFYVPPMIIFKRLRMDCSLANGAPPGSLVEVSESGYINSELFIKWLKHFISHVRPSGEDKVLLLLDGHTTHSKNFEAVNIARENGVLLLQLPGHTTHRLQPLDLAVFKPFQLYYDEAVTKWHRSNMPPLRQCHVSAIIAEAYPRAATMSNAIGGFKASGVWPTDRFVFNDADFITAELYTRQNEEAVDDPSQRNDPREESTGNAEELVSIPRMSDRSSPRSLVTKISEISPLPTLKPGKSKTRCRSGGPQRAELLTSSPYKKKLEETQKKKSEQLAKKLRRFNFAPSNDQSTSSQAGKGNKWQIKENKLGSQSIKFVKPEENEIKSYGKKNPVRSTTKTLRFCDEVKKQTEKNTAWFCFLCEASVEENMVQCLRCKQWVHESCSGLSHKDLIFFICDKCK